MRRFTTAAARYFLLSALVVSPIRSAHAAGDLIVAGQGARSAIIIGAQQPEYEFPYWGGDAILKRYLKLITGADVPVVTDASVAGQDLDALYDVRIWVGDQPRVRDAIGSDLAKLDDDGFVIRAVGRDIYLSGKKKWGTHWAAFEVLERFAGCRFYMENGLRWWMPQEDGTIGIGDIVPKAAAVALPADVDVVEQPSFPSRFFMPVPAHSFRERPRDQFSHNLWKIVDPRVYGATHPEYFPLINGARWVPPPGQEWDFQPCVSNPGVVDLAARAAMDYFAANPDASSFSLGMDDSDNYCDDDLQVAPPDVTGRAERLAWAFFDFYNKVAAEVARVYPDKRLGVLAYGALSQLPEGSITIDPMVVPYLTRDSAQLFDPAQVAEFGETVQRWSRMATRMGIYEYIYGDGFVVPRIYNNLLVKNLQDHYGVGVDGFYGEAYPNWGLDGPKYWLLDKLLWDDTQDPQALLDDYYTHMFGPVAATMKAYFDYLEEVWETQTLSSEQSNYRWYQSCRQLDIFTPEKVDHAWQLLVSAENGIQGFIAAASGDQLAEYQAVAARIAFFKTTFALTRTLSIRHGAAVELGQMATMHPVPFEAGQVLDAWLSGNDLHQVYDAVAALTFAITKLDDYDTLVQRYDSDPGPGQALHSMVEQTVDAALAGAGTVRSVGDVKGAIQSTPAPDQLVTAVASESGVLPAALVEVPPTIDGAISASEWGQPVFDGSLFEVYSITQRAPERTTIYAVHDADRLYLAFDLQEDPALVGAAVTGRDTDPGSYPRMVHDDAVALTLLRQGQGFQVIRVNANGSVQDFGGSGPFDVTTAAVGRTGTGWQVEMAIDVRGTLLDPALTAQAPTWVAVSRYTRTNLVDGSVGAVCSTLSPSPRFGTVIGEGTHPQSMVFVYGPRVVYLGSAAPAPDRVDERDVNGDGQVSVGDVFALVDRVMGGAASGVGGDVNGDGRVDVADVVRLIATVFS